MNYETTLRRRAAFIRLRNDNETEQAFITSAGHIPGTEVITSGALTQLVFPQASIPALLEAVNA